MNWQKENKIKKTLWCVSPMRRDSTEICADMNPNTSHYLWRLSKDPLEDFSCQGLFCPATKDAVQDDLSGL